MTDPGDDPGAGPPGSGPVTLALVIGVSRYPHLAKPAAGLRGRETFGLSELNVSALTAYRFAQWLKESYRLAGRPLARCWLLASPTDEELEAEPGLVGVTEPTFRNCEDAIWEWYSAARELSSADAKKSRLVFFFSGHGVERVTDDQLLLPSDYLARGLVNRAINIRDLRQGLAACGVPEQLFLIDACRNDTAKLRELGLSLTGTQVLNPIGNVRSSPDLDAPVLYGSATGQQAFAPRTVEDGLTLFGQALLSGLTAPPAGSLEHDDDGCRMLVHQLQQYMNARITQLLVEYGSPARQNVIVGGQSAGVLAISELACDAVVPIALPTVRDSEAMARTQSVEFTDSASGKLFGVSEGEDAFGDAGMAQLWSTRRLRPLDDDGAASRLTLVRVDRRATSLYDIVFRIDGDPTTSVLTLGEEPADGWGGYECHLPWVGHGSLFSLHLSRDEAGRLVRVETDLDLHNPGLLGRTAAAWRAYREQSPVAAASVLGDADLGVVATGASDSPLPVVVAGLVRLAAGRRLDPEMLDAVCDIYPKWSDPRVLRAESARRDGEPIDFDRLAMLSVPRTTEAIAIVWGHLAEATGASPAGERAGLRERLSQIVPWAQPGSLFPVIATRA